MVDKEIIKICDSLHNRLLNKGLDKLSVLEYKLLVIVREISREHYENEKTL